MCLVLSHFKVSGCLLPMCRKGSDSLQCSRRRLVARCCARVLQDYWRSTGNDVLMGHRLWSCRRTRSTFLDNSR